MLATRPPARFEASPRPGTRWIDVTTTLADFEVLRAKINELILNGRR